MYSLYLVGQSSSQRSFPTDGHPLLQTLLCNLCNSPSYDNITKKEEKLGTMY